MMKIHLKVLFASVLAFGLNITSSNAQGDNPMRFGIKGGINFSNLYADDVDETKMATGFNLGLFAKLPLANRFALQPEIYYTSKGGEVTYKDGSGVGIVGYDLDYIEVPLMLVINFTERFNIQAGPYAAFLVRGKANNESDVTLFNFEDDLDTGDFNTFEAGIAIGAGIDFKAISIGARYSQGLTEVAKERDFLGTSYKFLDAKNGVINLYISLALN